MDATVAKSIDRLTKVVENGFKALNENASDCARSLRILAEASKPKLEVSADED